MQNGECHEDRRGKWSISIARGSKYRAAIAQVTGNQRGKLHDNTRDARMES